jgi:RND family efflux transporter MFP subunit
MTRPEFVHSRGRHICALLVAGLIACALAGPVIAADPPQSDKGGPTVSVVPVARIPFVETILVTGSLVAEHEVLVSPQIEGFRISEILVEEGDHVAKDQVLARLSDDTLKAQLAQLEANLTKADASIAQARSRITEAEANKKQAEAAFARAEELIRSGTTSRSTYDEREAAARTSAAAVTLAQDGLLVAQADKTQIEAQIREAKLRLGYTDIKAPDAGIVSRRTAKVGALASAVADPLFRIIAGGNIELDAEVPEIYLPSLSVGLTARIEAAGLTPRTGKVRLISPEVDKATRLGRVRIFIGQDEALRIGSFARAAIDTSKKDALGIAATAVLNRDSGPTVQVVKNGVVETRKVVTGMRSGGKVEIVDGLSEGELIVLRSGTLLRDGDAVRAVVAGETSLNEAK